MENQTIGIVGAGLSGLTTAYRLAQAGIKSIIFEASNRIGGRVWTEKFPNGQTYELGGQYIDSNHSDIIELINELGLELGTTNTSSCLTDKYLVIDYDEPDCPLVSYSMSEINNDYQKISNRIFTDAAMLKPFDPTKETVKKLDNINLSAYVDDLCSVLRSDANGSKTKLSQLLKIAYQLMFGLEPELQSSLNFLFLIGSSTDINKFHLYGAADEMYHIKGGSRKLTDKLYQLLVSSGLCTINLNSPITKITRDNNNYILHVEQTCYYFPQIVMTIPFQMYDSIDYSEADFSPLKKYIIDNYKLGANSKLNIQYNHNFLDFSGISYITTDCANQYQLQNTWDSTIDSYKYDSMVFVNFTAGECAKRISDEFIVSDLNKLTMPLENLNILFEKKHEISNIVSVNWSKYPWTKGSYSVYKVGQYAGGKVAFAGQEALAEPQNNTNQNCHFAGEASSMQYQGYMNGAVFSGNRVVREILMTNI